MREVFSINGFSYRHFCDMYKKIDYCLSLGDGADHFSEGRYFPVATIFREGWKT